MKDSIINKLIYDNMKSDYKLTTLVDDHFDLSNHVEYLRKSYNRNFVLSGIIFLILIGVVKHLEKTVENNSKSIDDILDILEKEASASE